MIKRIKTNFLTLVKYSIAAWSALSTLACLILAFVTWDELGITGVFNKILVLLGIVIISVIFSVVLIFVRRKKKIFGDVNKGVTVRFDDLMKLSFPKKELSKRRIIVIPVNRCFDLSCENNLISENTIHGQWIKRFISCDEEQNKIHNSILRILNSQNNDIVELNQTDKKHGYLKRFPAGTVAEITGKNNIVFYLWGVSEFDSNLMAHCSEKDYYNAVQKLLDYYNEKGQGDEMFCPVIGDHIMRPNRNTDDIIHFLISTFKFSRDKIHGQINLIVYEKMKSDISILEY